MESKDGEGDNETPREGVVGERRRRKREREEDRETGREKRVEKGREVPLFIVSPNFGRAVAKKTMDFPGANTCLFPR